VTPEELILIFDKTAINTAQSIPISNGVTSINAIVLPIVIVADNQPAFVTSPHQVGQPGYTAFNLSENTQRQILNTVVADPDLDELLVTQVRPATSKTFVFDPYVDVPLVSHASPMP
jgi:hypothetical protein